MATLEELEANLKAVTEGMSKELTNLRIQNIQLTTRLESLVRMLVEKKNMGFDDYIDYIDSYIGFANKINELNKLEKISEKVTEASKFNEASLVRIYADDLNIVPLVQSTGNVSKSLLKQIYKLPCTDRFKHSIDEVINSDKESESN